MTEDGRPDFDAPGRASLEAVYSFMAQSREVEEEPAAPRRRFPYMLLGILVIVAALVFADRQSALLGGHVWAPAAEPTVPPTGLAFCQGVEAEDRDRIERAATEMRRAEEASKLLSMLIDEQICIGTVDLDYLFGYTRYGGSRLNPRVLYIVIDRDDLRYLRPDETAALLVHEAIHAVRILDGTNCFLTQDCEVLPNGNQVEEEVAAHSAEARFWIEIHGPTGTRSGIGWSGTAGSAYLNELVEIYNEGPAPFREFVTSFRSDPIELKEWTEEED